MPVWMLLKRSGIVRTEDLKLVLCEFFLIAQSPGTHATVLGVQPEIYG